MKRILIIDDSATILLSMEGVLAKAGYAIDKASSGEQALTMLNDGLRPDLIITDLYMGAMTGTDLIRLARQVTGLRFTPMLMVTTESQQDKRIDAKTAGATGWLVKPVAPAALLQVVRQVLPER
ncbi:response regulator [Magnetospirillum molischianum]|uniref:Two-component chemotaxis response transcriptional regulator cheY n=1 Tax=Magnetospirillum molischianum DSM 120 TaxID=1150626 RepID=H8FVG5_MAGML|nr:response regulator [Magnetospirillum molischianum]CCG42353.1 Two-component chemotaxis response transcriptional regulator cheY [Magnetospirillum molischianum DSM 120]